MLIGILGGGQLGRMLALAGIPLGLRFRFMDRSADCPAGQLADVIAGDFDDTSALARFADGLDVVTYEFENVPVSAARFLQNQVQVYPPPQALEAAQDRIVEKSFLRDLDIPVPAFRAIENRDDLNQGLADPGYPSVLKTRRFGYDGKGQVVVRDEGDVPAAVKIIETAPCILEQFVPFRRELSIISVRSLNGEIRYYPMAENVHRNGILHTSVSPVKDCRFQHQAENFAQKVLEKLCYVGVLAIELFETDDGLLVNEMAPRVHNSGHWSIEGSKTSQFENHIRAVASLPLGDTSPRGVSGMLNIIGSDVSRSKILETPGAHLHLYGKSPRPGRKLGHITLFEQDHESCLTKLNQLHESLAS